MASYDPRLASAPGQGGELVAAVFQIEGLPFDFTLSEHDITEVVARYGPVKAVQALDSALAPDVMLVEFESAAAARECVEHLEGLQVNVDGQQAVLRVRFFDDETDKLLQRKLEAAVQSADALKFETSNAGKFQCRFVLGGEEISPKFPITQRVLSDLRRIGEVSGARVRLRGRRSNLREGGEETDEPLHIAVQTNSDESAHRRACELIEQLMAGIYAEYAHFCRAENIPHRPIQLLCVEGSFHEDLDAKLALFRGPAAAASSAGPVAPPPPPPTHHQHHHHQYPAAGAASMADKARLRVCRLWQATGACHYGDRCQYAHASAGPVPGR